MARRRSKKSRRGGSKKLPLAIVMPLAAVGYEAAKGIMAGDPATAAYVFSGIDRAGNFNTNRLMKSYVPVLAGVIVHKVAGRVGVNRYIPKWLPVSI